MSEYTLENIAQVVEILREKSPLTHCITNVVTVKDCANAVLAVGASPIMANAPEEAEEIVQNDIFEGRRLGPDNCYDSGCEAKKLPD